MSLVTDHTPVPLVPEADGGIRVGGSRVTLETLVAVFMAGATAEEIVQRYPSLDLGDVYIVIGFYLHHREEIEEYPRRRQDQARQARNRQEARFDQAGLRERLLARRAGITGPGVALDDNNSTLEHDISALAPRRRGQTTK